MTVLYLSQVGKKNSLLLSQPRLAAVMFTPCRILHFFPWLLCIARVRGERELNMGTGVEQGIKRLFILCAHSIKHQLYHVFLYRWADLVPSSLGSRGSNGAGAFWAARSPVLQGCPHPSFKEVTLRHSFKLHLSAGATSQTFGCLSAIQMGLHFAQLKKVSCFI